MNDVLHVLMYFFEKIESDIPLFLDEKSLLSELQELGLTPDKVDRMLLWMSQLVRPEKQLEEYPPQTHTGIRIFTSFECARLSGKCRGFILHLEQMGILSPATRELVLDQLMQLDTYNIPLSRIKWITFRMLASQSNEIATACMERILINEELNCLH